MTVFRIVNLQFSLPHKTEDQPVFLWLRQAAKFPIFHRESGFGFFLLDSLTLVDTISIVLENVLIWCHFWKELPHMVNFTNSSLLSPGNQHRTYLDRQ